MNCRNSHRSAKLSSQNEKLSVYFIKGSLYVHLCQTKLFFNISLLSNMSEKEFFVSLCMWIDHSLLIMKNKRRRKGLKLLEYNRPSASYPDTCDFLENRSLPDISCRMAGKLALNALILCFQSSCIGRIERKRPSKSVNFCNFTAIDDKINSR